MSKPTDEMLMAYVDGQLDDAGRFEVEAILAANPALEARLRRFEISGSPLSALYSRPMQEPVPQHILATIWQDHPRPDQAAVSPPLRARFGQLYRSLFAGRPWAAALAFSVPVLGVIAAGAMLWQTGRPHDGLPDMVALDQGRIYASGALQTFLDTTPSGRRITLSAGASPASFESVLTFRNRHKDYCRQYEVMTDKVGNAGIACRQADGRWQVDVHTAVEPRATAGERIKPAGRGGSSIEQAVGQVMEGDALGVDEEQNAIRNGWKR